MRGRIVAPAERNERVSIGIRCRRGQSPSRGRFLAAVIMNRHTWLKMDGVILLLRLLVFIAFALGASLAECEAFGDDAELIPAIQTIYHDAAHPSHIVLPIIPR